MPSHGLPSLNSYRTLKLYFVTSNKEAEKLVLSQLDILLDKPTASPKRIYSTSPLRIHRVSDKAHADLDLVYNTSIKTLTISPCGPKLGTILNMARLPPSFDEHALRQQYDSGQSKLPPLAEYIYNAARASALIKHHNEREGPRDMRSDVALWMSTITQGRVVPSALPSQPYDLIHDEDRHKLFESYGKSLVHIVNKDDGYGLMMLNSNMNGLHVAVVKISSATLNPGNCHFARPFLYCQAHRVRRVYFPHYSRIGPVSAALRAGYAGRRRGSPPLRASRRATHQRGPVLGSLLHAANR